MDPPASRKRPLPAPDPGAAVALPAALLGSGPRSRARLALHARINLPVDAGVRGLLASIQQAWLNKVRPPIVPTCPEWRRSSWGLNHCRYSSSTAAPIAAAAQRGPTSQGDFSLASRSAATTTGNTIRSMSNHALAFDRGPRNS